MNFDVSPKSISSLVALLVDPRHPLHRGGTAALHLRVDPVQPGGVPAGSRCVLSQWASLDDGPTGPTEEGAG